MESASLDLQSYMNDIVIKSKYYSTFAYFEYRKIIRQLGGEVFEKNAHPFTTFLVTFLWFINFLISSVQYDAETKSLIFSFYNYPDESERNEFRKTQLITTSFISSVLFTQSLILVIIATSWQIRNIVEVFAVILFISTAFEIIVALVRDTHPYGVPAVAYLVTMILAGVTLDYLWYYYFVPSIIKWQWSADILNSSYTPSKKPLSTLSSLFPSSSSSTSMAVHKSEEVDTVPKVVNKQATTTTASMQAVVQAEYKKFKKSFFSFPYVCIFSMTLYLLLIITYWLPLIIFS